MISVLRDICFCTTPVETVNDYKVLSPIFTIRKEFIHLFLKQARLPGNFFVTFFCDTKHFLKKNWING